MCPASHLHRRLPGTCDPTTGGPPQPSPSLALPAAVGPPALQTLTCGCRFRIYTKAGDNGSSGLFNGQRLPKHDAYFQALGDVDELNSSLGVASEYVQECEPIKGMLAQVGRLRR